MSIFRKDKKEPVRLHKQEPKIKKINERTLIQIGILLGIILLLLLFVLLCIIIIPKTYGFYWW